jgi:hypothetical protein
VIAPRPAVGHRPSPPARGGGRCRAPRARRGTSRTASGALWAGAANAEQLAFTVAHDLEAPLTAIQGFVRALREDCAPALDDVGRNHLERIAADTRRAGQLIGDVVALNPDGTGVESGIVCRAAEAMGGAAGVETAGEGGMGPPSGSRSPTPSPQSTRRQPIPKPKSEPHVSSIGHLRVSPWLWFRTGVPGGPGRPGIGRRATWR